MHSGETAFGLSFSLTVGPLLGALSALHGGVHPVGTWREAMVRFRTSSYDSSLPGFSLTLSGMRMSERKLRSGSREDPEKKTTETTA